MMGDQEGCWIIESDWGMEGGGGGEPGGMLDSRGGGTRRDVG